jgi:hypothetical protein
VTSGRQPGWAGTVRAAAAAGVHAGQALHEAEIAGIGRMDGPAVGGHLAAELRRAYRRIAALEAELERRRAVERNAL